MESPSRPRRFVRSTLITAAAACALTLLVGVATASAVEVAPNEIGVNMQVPSAPSVASVSADYSSATVDVPLCTAGVSGYETGDCGLLPQDWDGSPLAGGIVYVAFELPDGVVPSAVTTTDSGLTFTVSQDDTDFMNTNWGTLDSGYTWWGYSANSAADLWATFQTTVALSVTTSTGGALPATFEYRFSAGAFMGYAEERYTDELDAGAAVEANPCLDERPEGTVTGSCDLTTPTGTDQDETNGPLQFTAVIGSKPVVATAVTAAPTTTAVGGGAVLGAQAAPVDLHFSLVSTDRSHQCTLEAAPHDCVMPASHILTLRGALTVHPYGTKATLQLSVVRRSALPGSCKSVTGSVFAHESLQSRKCSSAATAWHTVKLGAQVAKSDKYIWSQTFAKLAPGSYVVYARVSAGHIHNELVGAPLALVVH